MPSKSRVDINACFVSYRRTNDDEADAYAKAFVRQLEKHVHCRLPNARVYFDEGGLNVGDKYPEELAYQLCRSASMVLFFSSSHFAVEHPYCAMEYQAMLRLETQRLGATDLRNKGLIFPVVFRGLEDLPPEITSTRNYENFDNAVVESDFRRKDFQKRLKGLADQIFNRYQALINAGVFDVADCRQFRFPDSGAFSEWLKQIAPIRGQRMPGH